MKFCGDASSGWPTSARMTAVDLGASTGLAANILELTRHQVSTETAGCSCLRLQPIMVSYAASFTEQKAAPA